MAQQYYSMDQIAKLAHVSQQQVYYLINMKFKFKPTLTDPSGNKFYDERAVGQIFQELGKVLPKSAASPATDNGLLDINALAETTGLGKKKLRIFLREHKELKPDFVDEKNHNKKYWGPNAIQYINDHFGAEAEKEKAEEKTSEAEEKTAEIEEKTTEAEVKEAKSAEAAKTVWSMIWKLPVTLSAQGSSLRTAPPLEIARSWVNAFSVALSGAGSKKFPPTL